MIGSLIVDDLAGDFDVTIIDNNEIALERIKQRNQNISTINADVKDSIIEIKEVNKVDLDLVWDPPWDKSMMSEAAKLELNL